MDLNTILAWSVATVVVAGLIVYFRIRKKQRDRKTLEPLLAFARENNSEISSFDAWDKTLIGMDNRVANILFFMRDIPGFHIREKVNLADVSECKMVITERKVKYNKETVNVTDRIELVISFHSQKPKLSLEFYNTDYDHLSMSGELQFAQKWSGLIKAIIKEKNAWKAKKKTRAMGNDLKIKMAT